MPDLQTSPPNDDESILGVAISRQQTRLTSPETSATEKAQALHNQGAYFNDIAEEGDIQEVPTKNGRSFLRNAFDTRPRASSGSEITLDSLQKALLSIPRKFSLNTSQQDARQIPAKQDTQDYSSTSTDLGHSPLRRTVSDESLTLSRALSTVPSLGDDSRFQGVHAQVNSRFKAIKDSWQESNIKFPSIPSIASLTSEFFGQSQDRKVTDPMTRSPYSTLQEATADIDNTSSPELTIALAQLEGDVVVLGGYRGSILRSSTPPHKQLWVPIKVGLNLRKVDLEVGISVEDDLKPADDIIADGMLKHIGPVDISRRLFKRLRTSEAAQTGKMRVLDYGYDWRLDPSFLSRQLCAFLERLQCNQHDTPVERRGATVIAHSLGGLITRHAVNQRPELFRGVIYAGVPTRCINILGPLRNGDDVLLSSRVLTAQVNFTIRTSFALLPLDGRCFVDRQTHEEYPVDFFDPKTWLDHRLSPCIARPLVSLKSNTGIISSVAKALPSAARKISISRSKPEDLANVDSMNGSQEYRQPLNASSDQMLEPTVSTTVSIPFDDAYAYLGRMLANVKRFKQELDYRPDHVEKNRYPPVAVIYGKNTPTVIGAKVDGVDGIQRADAYDDLAFGSGDGVVLARAAMLPDGYNAARGGIVSSSRGHVSLLGDLQAVGKALNAIMLAR